MKPGRIKTRCYWRASTILERLSQFRMRLPVAVVKPRSLAIDPANRLSDQIRGTFWNPLETLGDEIIIHYASEGKLHLPEDNDTGQGSELS